MCRPRDLVAHIVTVTLVLLAFHALSGSVVVPFRGRGGASAFGFWLFIDIDSAKSICEKSIYDSNSDILILSCLLMIMWRVGKGFPSIRIFSLVNKILKLF